MADIATLRLFSWLSPAFPIGGFAFSQGLETAIARDMVTDAATLEDWIEGSLAAGGARLDAHALAIAHRAARGGDVATLSELNDLVLALQASAERHAETLEQARSFLAAARAWPRPSSPSLEAFLADAVALPVAVGTLSGLEAMPPEKVLTGFVNAWLVQQISVAVRLVPLGQKAGLAVQARLEPRVLDAVRDAEGAEMASLGGIAHGADIATMAHETQTTRIFRS